MATSPSFVEALAAYAQAADKLVEGAMELVAEAVWARLPSAGRLDLSGEFEALGEVALLVVAVRDGDGRLLAGPDSYWWEGLLEDLAPLLGVIAEVQGHEYLGETTVVLEPGY